MQCWLWKKAATIFRANTIRCMPCHVAEVIAWCGVSTTAHHICAVCLQWEQRAPVTANAIKINSFIAHTHIVLYWLTMTTTTAPNLFAFYCAHIYSTAHAHFIAFSRFCCAFCFCARKLFSHKHFLTWPPITTCVNFIFISIVNKLNTRERAVKTLPINKQQKKGKSQNKRMECGIEIERLAKNVIFGWGCFAGIFHSFKSNKLIQTTTEEHLDSI